MNSKLKIAIIAVVVLIVLVVGAVIIASVSGGKDLPSSESAAPTENSAPATPSNEPDDEPTVNPAGTNTTSATIAVGGDIVMHTGLNTEAYTGSGYDYTPIFGVLPDLISDSDYAVCSLVTTLAESGEYTAYPLFRSPASLADAISSVGFDLVNTATSHLADSYKDGIDSTLDALDAAGLAHVGTYRTQDERTSSGNRTMVELNGINVAFLAYTCDTNSVPVSGFEYAASICTTDYLSGGTEVDYDLMDSDIAAAREAGADIVFVFMSWGEELSTTPNDLQYEIADNLIANGADIIIGGRCRVPQPMETRTVVMEDGSERSGFVCYSLGNLLSCQNDQYTDISAIVNIEITKDNDTGAATVSNVSYRPIYMADLYDYGMNDYGWHYRVVDLHAAIASYDSGTPWEFINTEVYTDMVTALAAAHDFYGSQYDPDYSQEE